MTDIFFPAEPNRLMRTLSISYTYQGQLTNHAPSSYEGEERRLREDALIAQHPNTYYVVEILRQRALAADVEAPPTPRLS